MSRARTVVDFTVAGAFLGAVVASFVVPPALGWYNAPGNIAAGKPIETLCNVPELIRYATGHLLRGQLIGGAIGAVLFLLIGLLVGRRRSAGTGLPSTTE